MKTQHTPGPWARNISPAWKYPIYEEKNHNKIAYIIKDACISEAEQEANLNLIVAAPELLETLEGIHKALSRMIDKYDPDSIESEWLQHSNETILKAKGYKL